MASSRQAIAITLVHYESLRRRKGVQTTEIEQEHTLLWAGWQKSTKLDVCPENYTGHSTQESCATEGQNMLL
ncbi:hypothetical protein E2C01_079760 [Portunus trituberculatus]|uniref:Uncharacterized protein n=1 Tax=Portunus trituberculatus TaxID=210409 RepID=A0A5B7IMB4_PORTR|nr:hypothetical protein [Portunus trituberculatus]